MNVLLNKRRKIKPLGTWKDIEKIVRTSSLSPEIKKKGLHVYKKIIDAESSVHGRNFKTVHLHELGAVDCLVDIFGTIIGLQMLGTRFGPFSEAWFCAILNTELTRRPNGRLERIWTMRAVAPR